MPGRAISLVNDHYYHVFNRGNNKRSIFLQDRDFRRFQQTFLYYQLSDIKVRFSDFAKSRIQQAVLSSSQKHVQIIAYCSMPNHFHFLLKQEKENGIAAFISKLSNSYTKYFNKKYDNVGALFQGVFKAASIETDEQFLHVCRYIHINPVVAGLVKRPEDYRWSSYTEYLSTASTSVVRDEILGLVGGIEKYRAFVEDQIPSAKNLELLEHQLLE